MFENEQPQMPSEELVSEILAASERLGYLTTQLDEMFANVMKWEKHQVATALAYDESFLTQGLINGDLSNEDYATRVANCLKRTVEAYAEIDANHQRNMATAKQITQNGLDAGKEQWNEVKNIQTKLEKE